MGAQHPGCWSARGSGRKPAQACPQEGQASWKVTCSKELGSASCWSQGGPQLQARPDSGQAGNGSDLSGAISRAEEPAQPANSRQRPETHPKTARAETAGEKASHGASLPRWPLSFSLSVLPSGMAQVPGRDSCPQQRLSRTKAFSLRDNPRQSTDDKFPWTIAHSQPHPPAPCKPGQLTAHLCCSRETPQAGTGPLPAPHLPRNSFNQGNS